MTKRALQGSDFPALTSFVRGYLHEDFPEVHGSPIAAAIAFCEDANPDERRQLAEELELLAGIAASRPVREIRRLIMRDLGSQWAPRSRDEITDLLAAVRPLSGGK